MVEDFIGKGPLVKYSCYTLRSPQNHHTCTATTTQVSSRSQVLYKEDRYHYPLLQMEIGTEVISGF